MTVAPDSRVDGAPRDTLGTGNDAAHDFSTKVTCTNGQPIIAERPMYFNYNGVWTGGHDVVGATSPSSTFYFAEGTCRPGFDPYFCIQNPGSSPANVTLTYMKGDGTTATDTGDRAQELPRHGISQEQARHRERRRPRLLHQGDLHQRPEIIAERPMYFNYNGVWTGGHDVVGATSPASTFYFAEGTCRPGFDPYFCIQNPGSSTADVTLTYMKGDGTTATDTVTVSHEFARHGIPQDKLGTGDDAAHDFSTRVVCTNGRQIVVERPMYFRIPAGR